MNIHAPPRVSKLPSKFYMKNKWMTKGLIRSSCQLSKLRKKYNGKPAEDENVMHFKKYRNLFNRLIRQAKALYYTELFETHKESIKGTWRVLNDVIGKSRDKTCCTSMNIDGQSITNAASISNKFCDYFTEVGAKCAAQIPMSNTHYTQYLGRPHSRSIYLDPVTPGDIINIMNKMKGKSSTGHDSISSKLLKSVRGEIAYPLSVAIHSSLATGIVPDILKLVKVIPLYKAKDRQLLTNYRPISRLPSLSKVLEKAVHHKLMRFLNDNGLLYESQYGFRKHHNTIHSVTELVHNIIHGYEKGEMTIGVMADLSKAFDTIDHDILLKKLGYYGIRGIAHDWFRSYLGNRHQYVVFNDSKSYTKDLSCGVPQGSVLGPLLFLIYMNDMPNCLMTSHAILFADDTTLVASSRDPMQLYHDMNLDLDRLCNWFRSNKLSLNTSTTHYMEFFSLPNNTQCVKLEINDEV